MVEHNETSKKSERWGSKRALNDGSDQFKVVDLLTFGFKVIDASMMACDEWIKVQHTVWAPFMS